MINGLSDEKSAELKEEFKELLLGTNREGADKMYDWLNEESDFFTAPASSNGHGAYDGGLMVHSLNVYKLLKNFNKNIKTEREDSLVITGLLHDVCKTNFYAKSFKNVKTPGKREWVEREIYVVDDNLPLGHGEKSVFIIMRNMPLTEEEAIAIRWHMGGYDDAARSYISGRAQSEAYSKYPLAPALSIADMYATYFAD